MMRLKPFVALLLCALLAGCGAGATTTGTATTRVTATQPQTIATATRPAVGQIPASCNFGQLLSKSLVRVGNVVATQANPFLAYSSYTLPDNTPLKPLQISDPSKNPNSDAPLANPTTHDGGGYLIQVCNVSASQQHTLRDIAVRINGYQPYSGNLNSWNGCDGVYEAQSKQVQGGGCGGALGPTDEALRVTFGPNSGAGTTVSATQLGTGNSADPNGPALAPLPLALKPGQAILINLGLIVPTLPGTYTFTVGIGVDSAPDDFYSTTAPALFAPVAHKWSGQACESSNALKQIPPPTDPTYYICPGS